METLYIVACVANPLRWRSRIALARAAVADWLKEPNVHITLAECAYSSREWDLADLASTRVTHIPLRATTMAWSKECLLNIAIAHLPHAAEKIAALDADITFRRPGWATETLAALDLYPVIQPWDTAYDLGPHDEHVQTHRSFASVWHAGKPWSRPVPRSGSSTAAITPIRILATHGAGNGVCLTALAGSSKLAPWAPATITWPLAWSADTRPLCLRM